MKNFNFNHYFWDNLSQSPFNYPHLKVFEEFIMKSDLIITINEDIDTKLRSTDWI
jgi:hypothetical protein